MSCLWLSAARDKQKMKVLFIGDSPTVSTGFSRCTRAACDALHSAGHDVTVLGMGYYGDPHDFLYPIYPCVAPYDNARSYGGETRLASMIARTKPDIVVILQDPWNIPPYFNALDEVKAECDRQGIEFEIPPIVGWIAVDARNQKGEQLSRLSHLMVWTKFAGLELAKGGYEGSYDIVPLGVDTDLFYPRDRKQSRIDIGLIDAGVPPDAFIVGVVGRNQIRKRLELSLSYFAEWVHGYEVDDAYLYLHVAPTGEGSCDIRSLVKFYGLAGKVIVNTPTIGVGDPEDVMPLIYSSFDVYMTQSQAEGFGLPALEAMACGVRCLLPDHSAFGDDGWIDPLLDIAKVTCSVGVLTAPMNDKPYTIGSLPEKEQTVSALSAMYRNRHEDFGGEGLSLAESLTWKRSGEMFVNSLETFYRRFSTRVDVCVTVLNRYDLLRQCLESLVTTKNVGRVFVIDNGVNPEKLDEAVSGLSMEVSILNTSRLGLAESWNVFINNTSNQRIISNDDITFSPDSIARLTNSKADIVFPQGIGFSCFLLRDSCVSKVGQFDESLSPGFAYFEDCDYMNRIEKNGTIVAEDVTSHGITHLKNGTQHAIQENEADEYRHLYYLAQERFITKWGVLPPGLRRMEYHFIRPEMSDDRD